MQKVTSATRRVPNPSAPVKPAMSPMGSATSSVRSGGSAHSARVTAALRKVMPKILPGLQYLKDR